MILMLDPDTGDEQREKIASDVKSKLESGGEILHEANWGMRKMAYLIEKHESSEYRFFRFNGEHALLDDLDHSLKITDGVLRFRIFKSEPDAPVIVPPDTEQIMRRDEDDRERGGRREGGRGGPRRPRYEDEGGSQESSQPAPAPVATPAAEPAAEAPAAAAEAEAATEPVAADAE
jgi:small subunit ribosomal protein S6